MPNHILGYSTLQVIEHLKTVLTIVEKHTGERSNECAHVLAPMLHYYLSTNQAQSAATTALILRDILKRSPKMTGDLIIVQEALAQLAENRADLQTAMDEFTILQDLVTTQFGKSSPQTFKCRRSICRCLAAQRRFTDAAKELTSYLADGPPDAIEAQRELVRVLEAVDIRRAESECRKLLAEQATKLGNEDHPGLETDLQSLIRLAERNGSRDVAALKERRQRMRQSR
jgi:hypothetical protein